MAEAKATIGSDAKGRSKDPMTSTRLKKEQMTSVVWTTPLGLPIVQPYRKNNRKQITTSLQTVYISDPNSPAEGKLVCYSQLCGLLRCILFSELHETSFRLPSELYSQP